MSDERLTVETNYKLVDDPVSELIRRQNIPAMGLYRLLRRDSPHIKWHLVFNSLSNH